MSIFTETVTRAISEYRRMLRRHLEQSDRLRKLDELRLKDQGLYENDVKLYQTAWSVIKDIEENLKPDNSGYYAYSGIGKFCEYLKEYLNNYEIESEQIVHRAQKASRALVKAIQYATLPSDRLDDKIAQEILECNQLIAMYGSEEQKMLHRDNLERQVETHQSFYTSLLRHFQEQTKPLEAA